MCSLSAHLAHAAACKLHCKPCDKTRRRSEVNKTARRGRISNKYSPHFCSGARKLWQRRRAAWQTRKFILDVGGCDDVYTHAFSRVPFVLSLGRCAFPYPWVRSFLGAPRRLSCGYSAAGIEYVAELTEKKCDSLTLSCDWFILWGIAIHSQSSQSGVNQAKSKKTLPHKHYN
jgi:hypothetical protein